MARWVEIRQCEQRLDDH